MLKHESIMFNWQFVYKRGVLEMKDLDLESIWEREITVEDATARSKRQSDFIFEMMHVNRAIINQQLEQPEFQSIQQILVD